MLIKHLFNRKTAHGCFNHALDVLEWYFTRLPRLEKGAIHKFFRPKAPSRTAAGSRAVKNFICHYSPTPGMNGLFQKKRPSQSSITPDDF